MRVVRKSKFEIFLVRVCAWTRLSKKTEEVHESRELFYSFSGITSGRKYVYMSPTRETSSHRGLKSQEGRFISRNLFLGRIQRSGREDYFQIVALKVNQSAWQPGITNLAFQPFLLPAAPLHSKMA